MLRDRSALALVQTVACLAQCPVAGSIPSWIVLMKLDGTASQGCQKSAKKPPWLVPMGSLTGPTTKVKAWYWNHKNHLVSAVVLYVSPESVAAWLRLFPPECLWKQFIDLLKHPHSHLNKMVARARRSRAAFTVHFWENLIKKNFKNPAHLVGAGHVRSDQGPHPGVRRPV